MLVLEGIVFVLDLQLGLAHARKKDVGDGDTDIRYDEYHFQIEYNREGLVIFLLSF